MAPYVPTPALVTSADPSGNQSITGPYQSVDGIVPLASGGYVATWADQSNNFPVSTVRARIYDANGRPTSGEIIVGSGSSSSVTALADGGFAVIFGQLDDFSGRQTNVSARVYNANGSARNDAVLLDDAAREQRTPIAIESMSITALADGRIAAVWSRNADSIYQYSNNVLGEFLSSNGTPVTGRILIGTADNLVNSLAVTPIGSGGFALARGINLGTGTFILKGQKDVQVFDAAGQATTPVINLAGGVFSPVSATTLPDGRAAVSYVSDSNVFRLVSADGSLGPERTVGPNELNSERYPTGNVSVAAMSDGNLLLNSYELTGFSGGTQPMNNNIARIFTPEGAQLQAVLVAPTSSAAVALAGEQGSFAMVQDRPRANQLDVVTRVYQPAAVTSDPDGTPLVNDVFYNAQNPDVAAAGVDPDQHYDQYGWKEGRNPDALFNSDAYRFANPDVAAANIDPLQHYDQSGWKEGRDPSASFDDEVYLARNPDVKAAGIDPLLHYLQYGRDEGREISPAIGSVTSLIHGSFDAEYYLLSNPDVGRAAVAQGIPTVAAAAEFAYQHYETYGWHEGRNPNAYFDVTGYLTAYADVKAANVDPLLHYDQSGWKEGRDPSGLFDTTNYRASNSDVQAANIDPLTHFLQFGAVEGRMLLGDGSFE